MPYSPGAMKRDKPLAHLSLALAAILLSMSVAGAQETQQKVVIIGFDGADSGLVTQWMDEGKLPNLDALRKEGFYSPLGPTNPPQTPVSWSTFATGQNPGKTQIFDFLKRTPNTYIPTFAMVEESKKPFLYGRKNPAVMAAALGIGAAVLLGLLALLFTRRLMMAVVIGLVAGGAGAGLGWVAGSTWLPQEVPWAVNNRHGVTMWQIASEAGKTARVMRVPNTFPAEPVGSGTMLSGLGVPDMRGTVGRPTFYTSDRAFDLGDNEFSLELQKMPARSGTMETVITGPYNKPFYDYVVKAAAEKGRDSSEKSKLRKAAEEALKARGVPKTLEVPLHLEVGPDSVSIRSQANSATLKVGEWSDYFVIHFPVNWLVDKAAPLVGIGRFHLLQLQPEFQLYFSPVNFHPECHPVPFSYPDDYSDSLFRKFGLFRTIGWTEDTWSLPSGVGDEQHFLDDLEASVRKDEEMMEGILGAGDYDLYVQIFSFTDRIGHLWWRLWDKGHPAYDAAKDAQYGGALLEAYQRMDRIVGRARELAGPGVLFMVCSDHGFGSFRRGVNYNTWLVRNGYMTLKGGEGEVRRLEDLFDKEGGSLFQNVDWARTKAYAMGLGNIYINLVSREPQGSVLPGEEYEQVVSGIVGGLEALVDPKTGVHPVRRVYRRDDIYKGFDPALVPDLRPANELNYRVSWQTTLGGVPPEILEDNLKAWSGDHCSLDPSVVRGIFFSSRPIGVSDPNIIDIAPTALEALGLAPGPDMEGRDLLAAPGR